MLCALWVWLDGIEDEILDGVFWLFHAQERTPFDQDIRNPPQTTP
jgi:hypothetical protein